MSLEKDHAMVDIIRPHVISGGVIRGIRMYRVYTQSSLRDAKDWVEENFQNEIYEFNRNNELNNLREDSHSFQSLLMDLSLLKSTDDVPYSKIEALIKRYTQ